MIQLRLTNADVYRECARGSSVRPLSPVGLLGRCPLPPLHQADNGSLQALSLITRAIMEQLGWSHAASVI